VGTRRQHGRDLLSVVLVRDADHCRLDDVRMLVEDFLDLARIHVVPAPDQEILLAAGDAQVPVLVECAQVSGSQPAVRQRLGRRVGPVPVSLHHHRPALVDLAHLADADRSAVVAAHLDLAAR
jgi:hypothetical protein